MDLFEVKDPVPNTKNNLMGKVLIGLAGGCAIALTVVCYPFVSPALRRYTLPFIPATNNQLKNILSVLPSNSKPKTLLDIGSGDGRIVIETAKKGFQSDGVELNYWLVLYSRFSAIRKLGFSNKTKFFRQDLWKYNISKYDYCVIFGVEEMMEPLEKKLIKELNKEAQIVCCRFPFPNLKPVQTISDGETDTVWVYSMK